MKFNGQAYEKLYPRQKPAIIDEVPEEDKMVVETKPVESKVETPEVAGDGTTGLDEHTD